MDRAEKLRQINEESRKIFLAENREKLNSLLFTVLKLRIKFELKDINELKRFFHSIKGSASILGYDELAGFGKEYEEYVESEAKAKELTHKFFSKILEGIAKIHFEIDERCNDRSGTIKSIEKEVESVGNSFMGKDYMFSMGGGTTLIIDDDVSVLNLLDKSLREQGYNNIIISDPNEAMEVIKERRIDLILLDINMPEINGFELFFLIKEKAPELPVIFLSSDSDLKSKKRAFEIGAADYVIKPFDFEELCARIEKAIKFSNNVKKQLYIDKLTGAFSKDLFFENFKVAKKYFLERREYFSVAVVDIDSFKDINKNYGYDNGNYVLEVFYVYLRSKLSPLDQIYRVNVDKFLILFPNTKAKSAFFVLDTLRKGLAGEVYEKEELNNLQIEFSAGISGIETGEETVFEVIESAENVLKEAKQRKPKIRMAKPAKGNVFKEKNKEATGRVLIIEDSKNIVYLIKSRLEEIDYNVTYSNNGSTGLIMCQAMKPDILILDLMLPAMDGFEICKVLKKDEATKNVKIIVITSYSRKDYVVKCMKLGVDAFIIKPFSIQELEMRVKKMMEEQKNG